MAMLKRKPPPTRADGETNYEKMNAVVTDSMIGQAFKEKPRQPKLTGFGLTQAQQHDDGLLRLAVSRGCLTQAIAPNRETTQAKHQPNPK
ncbi:MAG: hypothetical protein QGI37_13300 [Verrucomicrobiota bacterium]|nr:hypothetical protein [Verrucomicrobiota bacterium]MDP7442704.1 hypothetical protein [Verrucomicrobiota bacterium]